MKEIWELIDERKNRKVKKERNRLIKKKRKRKSELIKEENTNTIQMRKKNVSQIYYDIKEEYRKQNIKEKNERKERGKKWE